MELEEFQSENMEGPLVFHSMDFQMPNENMTSLG